MANWRDIAERDSIEAVSIEKGIVNVRRWDWLDTVIPLYGKLAGRKHLVGDFARKINKPGFACCILCDCDVNYTRNGLAAFTKHAGTAKHRKKIETVATNYRMPGEFQILHAM